MLITNRERMAQLSSSIDCLADILDRYIHKHHPDIAKENVSRCNNLTISDILEEIRDITKIISGHDTESCYYYADLDIGYTEDNFPVKHR